MKKLIIFLLALMLLFSCVSGEKKNDNDQGDQNGSHEKSADLENKTMGEASDPDLSYAFGVSIGSSLKNFNVMIDYTTFVNGMKDVLEKDSPKITAEEANQQINDALRALETKKMEADLEKENKYFEENKKKEGMIATDSGLQYEVITMGSGEKPQPTDTVKVHYVGTLLDGTEFDSSVARGEPATFPVNGVITGWTEGLQLMPVGSKFKFYIPARLAYGSRGAGENIGPNSTLIFEVELLSIEKGTE